ncbi:MAG: hypothetical protein M2R45_00584 [Verrucomicrobia subdivision 3 bacterium]|nr:hypothetical protein [Limisphaerales bacterium]MCS1413538.1 hypothetical protein [Limisphaerales bacterium]
MNPLFDSRFPHGRNQWISIAGASRATMDMLLATPQAISDSAPQTSLVKATNRSDRNIKPLLKQSCVRCRRRKRPKARFHSTSRATLMQRGEKWITSNCRRTTEREPAIALPFGANQKYGDATIG